MRTVLVKEHGGPEKLLVEELPDPEPGPGQVRVRIHAAGINHLDLPVQIAWGGKRVRRYGVLRPPWEYIVSEQYSPQHGPESTAKRELYHLGRDPGEQTSRWRGAKAKELGAELRSLLDRHREIAKSSPPPEFIELPKLQLERLRALGYIE